MPILTHAKFHFNPLTVTLIFGIRASEPPPGPGGRLKRLGLIGLRILATVRLMPLFELLLEYLLEFVLTITEPYHGNSLCSKA